MKLSKTLSPKHVSVQATGVALQWFCKLIRKVIFSTSSKLMVPRVQVYGLRHLLRGGADEHLTAKAALAIQDTPAHSSSAITLVSNCDDPFSSRARLRSSLSHWEQLVLVYRKANTSFSTAAPPKAK